MREHHTGAESGGPAPSRRPRETPSGTTDPRSEAAPEGTGATAAGSGTDGEHGTENREAENPGAEYRCGIVALVGRPNAGKSTLMNQLLPEKLAIVSAKPQTTRNRLVGILSEERGQMVFYDTPGVHKPQHRMNREMIKAAQEALNEADAVCLLVDASQPHGRGDEYLLRWVSQVDCPKILLLNKVDRVPKPELLPRMARYGETGQFEEIVPISALHRDGTELVKELLWRFLPVGPPAYDPELLTVHPERFLVAERIREKVLEQTADEVPFATAVVVDHWQDRSDGPTVIHASILAEKEGQKAILVGAGGRRIKAIGEAARRDIEAYLETRVYLDLKVRLERNWRESRRILTELDREVYAASLE
ncbi:MAG: GTPase Era [Holophagales bacterium]|nr:GTPase Era [Holophagales bacterium]